MGIEGALGSGLSLEAAAQSRNALWKAVHIAAESRQDPGIGNWDSFFK